MKTIGFITAPLTDENASRGVGFYTRRLLKPLMLQAESYGLKIKEVGTLSQLKTDKFDLIHYPYFDLFYPTLKPTPNIPFVVTVHDVIPLEFPTIYPPGIKGTLNLFRQKISLLKASLIITDSYASLKSIHSYLGVPHNKIKLIFLSADSIFAPVKNKHELATIQKKYKLPDRFILFVGDYNWNKNVNSLIQASQDINIPLVWVGKSALHIEDINTSHPQLAHLEVTKQLVKKGGVHRLGFVPDSDLLLLYNLATVYCQPSLAEGFGLPVLEAMACGTPVISSRTHSLPEIAGDAAIYFDPTSLSSITATLTQTLSDLKQLKALSDKSLIQAQKFSWEKTAHQSLQAYKEVLS